MIIFKLVIELKKWRYNLSVFTHSNLCEITCSNPNPVSNLFIGWMASPVKSLIVNKDEEIYKQSF